MVLVQGPARSKRSSLAWSYAKGGDSCVYSRKLSGAPSYLGATVPPSKRARSGALVSFLVSIVACWCRQNAQRSIVKGGGRQVSDLVGSWRLYR